LVTGIRSLLPSRRLISLGLNTALLGFEHRSIRVGTPLPPPGCVAGALSSMGLAASPRLLGPAPPPYTRGATATGHRPRGTIRRDILLSNHVRRGEGRDRCQQQSRPCLIKTRTPRGSCLSRRAHGHSFRALGSARRRHPRVDPQGGEAAAAVQRGGPSGDGESYIGGERGVCCICCSSTLLRYQVGRYRHGPATFCLLRMFLFLEGSLLATPSIPGANIAPLGFPGTPSLISVT
jgi:hypothetical protein